MTPGARDRQVAEARHGWALAAARGLADRTRPGTLARRAAGCVAVALSTTRTVAGARKALADVRPEHVRHAAEQLLDALTTDTGSPQ